MSEIGRPMLFPYRVLDLTTGDAALGPMILADLGADVVKIESAAGLPQRTTHATRFAAFNQNKRSVAIDLSDGDGRRDFLGLVAACDVLFENDPPGGMAARGLGFAQLAGVNSRLVYVATTPFGQDGPYASHAATDLTLAALGGMMAVNGDADRPPIRLSAPQACLHGATESAVAALIAHRRMLLTGQPQFVDVSIHAAVFWTLMNAMSAWAIQGFDFERNGGMTRFGERTVPLVWTCLDGEIILSLGMLRCLPVVIRLMAQTGAIPASWTEDEDWDSYVDRVRAGHDVIHSLDDVVDRVKRWVASQNRESLLATGIAHGAAFVPVNSIADMLQMPHLNARRFWQLSESGLGAGYRLPGPFVRFKHQPIAPRRGVPAAGADTEAVLAEWTARTSRAIANDPMPGPLPFSGIKVADFSWVGVAPMAAKYLADHGATTVHIESANYPDVLRRGQPFKDGIAGLNRSQYFGSFNTSKWSIALDLKQPLGQAVGRRLLAWADVCLESFTPGVMAGLGLGFEVAHALNPRIVWASSCLMGQSGPLAPLAGFGYHAAAMAGFTSLSGWPDRGPCNIAAPYTDTIANRFLAISLLAAMDRARRTGEGEYIEQSQLESALQFLTPEILEYQQSGEVPSRQGNGCAFAAPHNAYPCQGDDQWCAIAVETDAQWLALRRLMGEPDWAVRPEFAQLDGRLAQRDEIDVCLAAWTRGRERYALMAELQAAGVPAGAMQRSSDLRHDPQLAHRHFFRVHRHAEMGDVPYEGHQFRIQGYDSGPRWAAPALGEHSFQVMSELLGMTDEEIAELAASGALV